jgi:hypothetical protein
LLLLKNIRISRKILLLLGLLMALSAAITGFAAYNISDLARSERGLVNGDGASLRWAASAQEHMTRAHQLVFQVDDTDFSASGALRSRLADEERGLNSDLDHFRAVMTPNEQPLDGAVRLGAARYESFAANDIRLLQTAGRAPAEALLLSTI